MAGPLNLSAVNDAVARLVLSYFVERSVIKKRRTKDWLLR
jgi:hypothetical protein